MPICYDALRIKKKFSFLIKIKLLSMILCPLSYYLSSAKINYKSETMESRSSWISLLHPTQDSKQDTERVKRG